MRHASGALWPCFVPDHLCPTWPTDGSESVDLVGPSHLHLVPWNTCCRTTSHLVMVKTAVRFGRRSVVPAGKVGGGLGVWLKDFIESPQRGLGQSVPQTCAGPEGQRVPRASAVCAQACTRSRLRCRRCRIAPRHVMGARLQRA